jgi:hypothetical protein
MRKQIVDKLFEYGERLKQRQLTVHLAISYLDLLMHKQWVAER